MPTTPSSSQTASYSVSLVTQGRHKFYTLTMPSEVLGETCFVIRRTEDPDGGFQRNLDQNRAQQIADYIDHELGTIPGSIILSAQPEAELAYDNKRKTIRFFVSKKAFLILDGQHRVYGFSLAKASLRVPVVIYDGLTRQEETKLFMDINTKQRSVPNELLLDIKKLAEYESESEAVVGEIFDLFNQETNSPLLGLMSPSERTKGKISRVTFNAALNPLMPAFGSKTSTEIYEPLRAYITAFMSSLKKKGLKDSITKPAIFRAAMLLFTEVGQRVKDKHENQYTVDAFQEALQPLFERIRTSVLQNPPTSHRQLHASMSEALRTSFVL